MSNDILDGYMEQGAVERNGRHCISEKKEAISISIKPSTKRELVRLSKEHGLSVSSYVQFLLDDILKDQHVQKSDDLEEKLYMTVQICITLAPEAIDYYVAMLKSLGLYKKYEEWSKR